MRTVHPHGYNTSNTLRESPRTRAATTTPDARPARCQSASPRNCHSLSPSRPAVYGDSPDPPCRLDNTSTDALWWQDYNTPGAPTPPVDLSRGPHHLPCKSSTGITNARTATTAIPIKRSIRISPGPFNIIPPPLAHAAL